MVDGGNRVSASSSHDDVALDWSRPRSRQGHCAVRETSIAAPGSRRMLLDIGGVAVRWKQYVEHRSPRAATTGFQDRAREEAITFSSFGHRGISHAAQRPGLGGRRSGGGGGPAAWPRRSGGTRRARKNTAQDAQATDGLTKRRSGRRRSGGICPKPIGPGSVRPAAIGGGHRAWSGVRAGERATEDQGVAPRAQAIDKGGGP